MCLLTLCMGAQWLSGRVLDSWPRGGGFEPHRRHCVVSLSKTHLSLLSTGSNQEGPCSHNWKIVDWDVKNHIKQTNKHFAFWEICFLFSSPEPKGQGEPLWYRSLSVVPRLSCINFFKCHLLLNHRSMFKLIFHNALYGNCRCQISVIWSSGTRPNVPNSYFGNIFTVHLECFICHEWV